MNETSHTLILRLWLDRECLRGSVSTPDGDPHEFSGRLGLIGAIDDLLTATHPTGEPAPDAGPPTKEPS